MLGVSFDWASANVGIDIVDGSAGISIDLSDGDPEQYVATEETAKPDPSDDGTTLTYTWTLTAEQAENVKNYRFQLREKAGDFDFVPNTGKQRKVDYVQSNNYAFGGNNASIIYAKEGVERSLAQPNKERIFITGFGIVSPLGNTEEEYAANVNAGAAAKRCENCGDYISAVGKGDFDAVGIKLNFYRKLDKLSQMTCVSGKRALANAGITVSDENSRKIGIVAGTSDGPQTDIANFQKGIIANGTQAGSAFLFPNTVYNAAPGYFSIAAGVKGYNVTLSNGAASGIAAVAFATRVLHTTQNDVILAIGADEDSETVHMLYEKAGAIAAGMTPGDGAVTVVLERESSANARGAKKYAEVLGSGFAHCPTEFGKYGCAGKLKEAIGLALRESGVSAGDIGMVMTCTNGVNSLEEAEKDALADFTGAKKVSVKALCGEGRAASSALSGRVNFTVEVSGATSRRIVCPDCTRSYLSTYAASMTPANGARSRVSCNRSVAFSYDERACA